MGQPVMHWQMVSKNPDALGRFYTALFGRGIHANNALGYRMVDTGAARGIHGGIWPAPPGAGSFVQLLIGVEDVVRYVTQATALGAKVIVPPRKLPDGDEMAVLQDPEGIPFGIFRPAEAS